LWGISTALAESPVLVRDATVANVQTLQGSVRAQVTPVNPSHELTIIVLADTLSADDAVRVRREIASTFTTAFLNGHHVQLVALSGAGGDFSTPLTTTAQFQAALKRVTPAVSKTPVTPETLIETLGAIPPSLPSNWANVVIAGVCLFSPETKPGWRPGSASYIANNTRVSASGRSVGLRRLGRKVWQRAPWELLQPEALTRCCLCSATAVLISK
jgi:hypothetical protein